MLTLQLGQCGNQLGESLFEKVNDDTKLKSCPAATFEEIYEYSEISNSKWFEGHSKSNHRFARSILIDTERKVIDKLLMKPKSDWCYRPKNVVSAGSCGGSANNWAFGFAKKGPEYKETVLDVVRTELERADRLEGFLCLLSCAGGTGSGLGSYMIQTLRDNFPGKNIIASLVLPFNSGEVATQNYNVILSLAKILDDADLVLLLENEKLRSEVICLNSGTAKSIYKMKFPNDINEIASKKILSILQPAVEVSGHRYNGINYIVSKLSPHPAYKIATIEASPLNMDMAGGKQFWNDQKSGLKWQSHFNMLKTSISSCRGSKSISNILITRGTSQQHNVLSRKNHFHQKKDDYLIHDQLTLGDIYENTTWLDSPNKFTHFHQNRQFLSNKSFCSIATNNSKITRPFEEILESGWRIYSHGAFLHQYKRYGVEDDDFLRAFAKVENIVASYKSLET